MARDDDRLREVVYQISLLEKERAELDARIRALSDEKESLTRTPEHVLDQRRRQEYIRRQTELRAAATRR